MCTSDPKQAMVRDLAAGRSVLPACRRAATACKRMGLPPEGRLVRASVRRKTCPTVKDWPGVVSGPVRSGDEWEMLVRIPTQKVLELEPHIGKLRRGGKARVSVE